MRIDPAVTHADQRPQMLGRLCLVDNLLLALWIFGYRGLLFIFWALRWIERNSPVRGDQ